MQLWCAAHTVRGGQAYVIFLVEVTAAAEVTGVLITTDNPLRAVAERNIAATGDWYRAAVIAGPFDDEVAARIKFLCPRKTTQVEATLARLLYTFHVSGTPHAFMNV